MACLAVSTWAKEMPKAGFGVQFGWAQPLMRMNNDGSHHTLNTVHLKGLKAGVVYDASFVAGFGSSIGINYTYGNSHTKWAKKDLTFSERKLYDYHQLELFVDWQYKFEVAKETYIILYTGPSLQCGLKYNNKYELRNDALREKVKDQCTSVERYDTDQHDLAMRRLNVTWGVGVGFQYQRYFLRGGYDFGLVNPYKHEDFANGNHTHGRIDQWNIRAGVYLWYK